MTALMDQYSDEELIELVKASDSYAEVCRRMGYTSYSGSVAEKIKNKICNKNIDISHFHSKQYSKLSIPENQIFITNSHVSRNTLRRYYKQKTLDSYYCSICGQSSYWQNKELSLILDHINGINNDNRLENLRWVCPNCNQQLPTTGSRNIKKKDKSEKHCVDCGKPIYYTAIRCVDCENERRKNNSIIESYVDRDTLKNKIRNQTLTSIAKEYGKAGPNSIKKWCKHYDLPSNRIEIDSYSDEEWASI